MLNKYLLCIIIIIAAVSPTVYYICSILFQHTTTVMELDISRDVTQYHFTSWPDHGVPEYAGPILNYLRRIKTESKSDTAPLLVHCRYFGSY